MPDKHETQGMLRTASGSWFDINDPYNSDINIEDIAHALSMICRYNGQVPSFYSVAEHCCFVADWLDSKGYAHLAFEGLMHDAAEAYVGDIIRPMKIMDGFKEVYNQMEAHVEMAIGLEFDVSLYPMDPKVKEADMAVYEWEVENIRSGKMVGLSPDEAKNAFISFYNQYKPKFTKESQMINDPNVKNLTDEQMDEVEDLDRAISNLDSLGVEAEKMPHSPRRDLLMNAADLVDGDRNAQYGDPRQDFQRTAKYWNAHINGVIERKLAENDGQFTTDEVLSMEDVAIMMSLLKISRLAWQPQKEDTWTDLAGYAACGWDCARPE